MHRSLASVLAVVAALAAWSPTPVAANFTCSTVARSGQNDPVGQPFVKRFVDLDINQGGDVLFHGRASGMQPRLYLCCFSNTATRHPRWPSRMASSCPTGP